jgi:hypothetical protein
LPRYLTCEAELNFPVPDPGRLAAQLRAMYDGRNPVGAKAVAQAFGLIEGAIVPVLRRAEQCVLVRKVEGRGWIPLQT